MFLTPSLQVRCLYTILFIFPCFYFSIPLFNIRATNYFLFFFLFALLALVSFNRFSSSIIPALFASFLILLLCLFSSTSVQISIAIICSPLLFYLSYRIIPRLLFSVRIVGFTSFLNASLCFLQIFLPSIAFENLKRNTYDVSLHANAFIFFIPQLGRLRGLFNENGPMVCYLLLYSSFLLVFIFFRKHSPINLKFIVFPLIVNLALLLCTGSKVILFLPLVILYFYILFFKKLRSFSVQFLNKPLLYKLPFVIIFVLAIGFSGPIVANAINSILGSNVLGLLLRLSLPSAIEPFSTFGLQPSSEGLALSLSAFGIYGLAWGYIPATLLISLYLLVFLRSFGGLILFPSLLYALFSSGSFLIPFYSQAIFLLAILERYVFSTIPKPVILNDVFHEEIVELKN